MRASIKEVITDYIHISDYVSKYKAHKDPAYILKRERVGKFFLFHKYEDDDMMDELRETHLEIDIRYISLCFFLCRSITILSTSMPCHAL